MSVIMINPYRFGSAPPSYLLTENFEAPGYENSWTETGTGTIDEAYAVGPLAGTYSLRIANTAQPGRTQVNFSAQSDVWAFFTTKFTTLPATGKQWFRISDSADANVLSLEFQASGTIRVRCGTANATTVAGMSTGTQYFVWVRYTNVGAGSSYAEIAFSSTTTKPTSGNNFASTSTGSVSTNAEKLMFGSSGNGTWDTLFDTVRVKATAIGDNPA